MKIRNGFVSNSSSSSFIVISVGDEEIIADGDTDLECCGSVDLDIDVFIKQLQEAKNKGIEKVNIIHGGGYEG